MTNKRIAFGILSFGGIFGLGEKQYAIPWDILQYKEKGEKFILDVDKEKLTGAESFDPNKYPYPDG
ncbi:MAG: PRC-barrel domain-containing protein [Candidatus Atribacteria bacterium]|nr:PRC-barrel domain-containing protein [Candidatus Atribacteria bacterium]MBE3102193.1 PRC-barrel domain-containing protein [Bacillota bacterium]